MSIPATAIGNGVVIVRTGNNCYGVAAPGRRPGGALKVEVDYQGRLIRSDYFETGEPYRDSLDVDLDLCRVRVLEATPEGVTPVVLAELGYQPQGDMYQPWMVLQGEQAHVTESSVSVPPALHITDPAGARWTLGFSTAAPELSPKGEFAFNVIRDGVDMALTASRLEIRGGQVRAFTRHGWKRWLGREWS